MKTAAQELLEWIHKMPKVPISRDLLVSRVLICIEKEKDQLAKLKAEIMNVKPVNEPDVWQGKKEKI